MKHIIATTAAFCLMTCASLAMPMCGSGKRISCVVDGDTFWIDGEKVRIEGIDAPEVHGSCPAETAMAKAAATELARLLADGPIVVFKSGKDRYGRTLARVETGGNDIGAALIAAKLARHWRGRKETWCE